MNFYTRGWNQNIVNQATIALPTDFSITQIIRTVAYSRPTLPLVELVSQEISVTLINPDYFSVAVRLNHDYIYDPCVQSLKLVIGLIIADITDS